MDAQTSQTFITVLKSIADQLGRITIELESTNHNLEIIANKINKGKKDKSKKPQK
jgi:hypothetical protein